MLLPDSMELRICVPYNSRSTAWVSFDGRGRVELQRLSLDATFHSVAHVSCRG
jgi:NAD kinase